MRKMRLLLATANILSVLGEAQWPPPDQAGMVGGDWQQGGGGGGQQGGGQCGVMLDECCGMANEGCCMGGQQCYTYYETVCEKTQTQRCQPKFKQVCVNEVLPDCRIEKKRATQVVHEEVCIPIPKRECFTWNRKVCDMRPAPITAKISWQNEKLVPKEGGAANKTECVKVKQCEYEEIENIETENVPKEKCEDIPETRNDCRRVPVPRTKVVQDVSYEVRYEQQCSQVNQPRCETSPCQLNGGCTNGGSVCSQQDYQPQTVCAEALVSGEQSNCQQVNMPVCYGELQSCSAYDQQCCYNQPTQVCGQIQRRVPVTRNRTVTYYDWEEKCETVEFTRKECNTEWETVNKTVISKKCKPKVVEECLPYTVPQYEVKLEDKSEKVSFVSRKCSFRNVTEEFCQTFPQADYKCSNSRPSQREYILNKVVCKEQKDVKFCMNIPEGECENVPDQKCRVVPRQVCQPGCSTSNMCNQCDSFRNQGGFSSCSTGTCPNFFPEDPTISGVFGGQGGSGFNPGNQGGFYPGNQGDSGFNPGYGSDGGWGYNPGQSDLITVGDDLANKTEWNPGNDWYSPQEAYRPLYPPAYGGYAPLNPAGDSGYNPGAYTPLNPAGDSGYNPGAYTPLNPAGDSGYNPGAYAPLNPAGDGGYNPGSFAPLNPDQGWGQGGGYNPGDGGWETGGGFNPGAGVVAEAQVLDSESLLKADDDIVDDKSLVL